MPIQNEIIYNPNHPKDNEAKQMPKRVSLFELPVLLSLKKHCSTNNIFYEPFFPSLAWSLLMMSMVHCYVLWAQGHSQRQWIVAFLNSTTSFLEFVVGRNNWLTTIWVSSSFLSLCVESHKDESVVILSFLILIFTTSFGLLICCIRKLMNWDVLECKFEAYWGNL